VHRSGRLSRDRCARHGQASRGLALAHIEAGHSDPPAIHSVVVLLGGPAEVKAGLHQYGIGWDGRPFNGVHFHVDRIDLLTVAELAKRPGRSGWL